MSAPVGLDGLPRILPEGTGTCRLCGQPVTCYLGQWTDPDGCISCPGAAGVPGDHEPWTDEALDALAERAYEQQYRPGVSDPAGSNR